MFIEQIRKIAVSSNDDKRLQTFDKITANSYTANARKAYKTELVEYLNIK